MPSRSSITAKEYSDGCTTDKIKGTANEAIGKAKQGIGEATGSDRLQGEGVIQEVKGKGQKAMGDAKEATKDAVEQGSRRGEQESLIDARSENGKDRPRGRSFFWMPAAGHDEALTAAFPSHPD